MRDFDSGEDQRMSAMDFLCEANQIVPSVSRRTGAKGVRGAFEAAYLHQLTKQGLVIWGTSTVLLSLVLALLPSILRSLPNSQFSTGSCGSFVSSGVEGLITSLYFAVGFSCTIGLSMVLVRMFVQFVHINRSWRMFSAIHHPVRARQRKERPVLISAITDDAGKLTGYLDMRRPENVQAWSKLRLYMQLFYEDEVRGVEIFLAHTVVLLVLIVISGGIFVYIPVRAPASTDGGRGGTCLCARGTPALPDPHAAHRD